MGREAPYVVAFAFGGRRDRMQILNSYLDKLLHSGSLAEVHLWDMAKALDRKWLRSLDGTSQYSVLEPDTAGWLPAYRHYSSSEEKGKFRPMCDTRGVTPGDDSSIVFVKSDDDIVFIDIHQFPKFTAFAASHSET